MRREFRTLPPAAWSGRLQMATAPLWQEMRERAQHREEEFREARSDTTCEGCEGMRAVPRV